MAGERADRAEHWPADSDARLHPGVAWRFFQSDERAHERNENRRADFESKFFGDNEMPAFVDEQEHHKADRELPTPHHRVNPDHQQHRAAGLEQERQELERGEDEEFQFRKKLRDYDAYDRDRAERFLQAAPPIVARLRRGFDWRAFGWRIHELVFLSVRADSLSCRAKSKGSE